jgi:RNA polymerase sigma-70 factor (ECF subfamily)
MTPEAAFDRYGRSVYRFVCRLTRREDIAQDVVQETFLALVRAPGRFDAARGSIQTYLFAIARNLVLKHFRDYRGEEQLEEEESSSAAIDPRRSLELGAAVASAVADLPPLQQEALILFEYEGVTLEELAQIVAADVGTVKARLRRARERLRRTLAPYRTKGKVHGTI